MSRPKPISLPGKPLPADAERPSAEAQRHADYEVRDIDLVGEGGASTTRAAVNTTQRPIDRLRKRGLIADREWAAGDRLIADWYQSGIMPRLTSNLLGAGGGSGGGLAATERQQRAWERYRDAMAALGRRLGLVARLILVEEMTISSWASSEMGVRGDRPQQVAGMTALRLALDALADHYGMP